MYQSVENKNIVLSISAMWTGENDIYDPDIKAIELGIMITNKSKKDICIDQIIIGVRKNPLLPFPNEERAIPNSKQVIAGNSEVQLTFDLKPVLNLYGKKRRVYIKAKYAKTNLMSIPTSISEMHSEIISIYARHF